MNGFVSVFEALEVFPSSTQGRSALLLLTQPTHIHWWHCRTQCICLEVKAGAIVHSTGLADPLRCAPDIPDLGLCMLTKNVSVTPPQSIKKHSRKNISNFFFLLTTFKRKQTKKTPFFFLALTIKRLSKCIYTQLTTILSYNHITSKQECNELYS